MIIVSATPINVTLPSIIELGFSGTDIETVIPNNLSVGTVKVSEVKASLKGSSWTLSSDEAYKNLPLDSKQLYLGFGKAISLITPVTNAGFDSEITLSPRNVGEITLGYEKVDEVVPISIFINGKENIIEKNTFTFHDGTTAGLGNIQGYNKVRNSKPL